MKFILFVEGYTERKAVPAFLKRWLDVRLTQSVGIQPVRFEGWAELVQDAPKKARLYLENPRTQGEIIAVIALLDLYGPTFYPPDKITVTERYDWATAKLMKDVGHPKFYAYFAVHEIEAWLLSDANVFPDEVKKLLPKKAPETVNFDTPPAKLLEQLYESKLRRTYKKVTDGENLFPKLSPEVAVAKCPYLKRMLDEMLALANAAGQ